MDELSVEELIAAASAPRTSVGDELGRLRQRAKEGGVEVTVDLYGKLVDLDIDQRAMALPPDVLAALIRRLAGAAWADVLATGITTLAGAGDPLLGSALASRISRTDHVPH